MVVSSLLFINLTQNSVILAQGNTIKELFSSDLPVGESVDHFLYSLYEVQVPAQRVRHHP